MMYISTIYIHADSGEQLKVNKHDDGYVLIQCGAFAYFFPPHHRDQLVALRDALDEILIGVPVPDPLDDYPKCTNGHDRCYEGPSENCPYCEQGPQPPDEEVIGLTDAEDEQ